MNAPHDFSRKSRSGYVYCAHCCLVALSNDATRKAIQRGCPEKALKDKEERARKKKSS